MGLMSANIWNLVEQTKSLGSFAGVDPFFTFLTRWKTEKKDFRNAENQSVMPLGGSAGENLAAHAHTSLYSFMCVYSLGSGL